MAADPGPLNSPISCRKDGHCSHTMEDQATIRPDIVLSEEQANILAKVKKGDSVFITGPAGLYFYPNRIIFVRSTSSTHISGTGKTVLLREIINFLGGPGRRVAVTASTGIASINISGTTLHSWAGIGLGKESVKRLSGQILGTKDLRRRWWFVRSLIIDESKSS